MKIKGKVTDCTVVLGIGKYSHIFIMVPSERACKSIEKCCILSLFFDAFRPLSIEESNEKPVPVTSSTFCNSPKSHR